MGYINTENKPEITAQLVGSSMALLAVAFEAMGENLHIKCASKTSSATAFKIFAGGLGTIGGVIGLYVDGTNFKETNSNTLKYISLAKLVINFALTLGQAGVVVSSVAKYLGNGILNRAAVKFSQHYIVAALAGARVIAGLTLISVGLVVIEGVLKSWVLDDELEDWCQKTPFRKANSKESPFKNEEEYQEFVKAVVSV